MGKISSPRSEINIIPPHFSRNSLHFKNDSRCLDANHRKGGTEQVEIKNEDDKTKKEEERAEAEEKMEVEKVDKKRFAPRRRG